MVLIPYFCISNYSSVTLQTLGGRVGVRTPRSGGGTSSLSVTPGGGADQPSLVVGEISLHMVYQLYCIYCNLLPSCPRHWD